MLMQARNGHARLRLHRSKQSSSLLSSVASVPSAAAASALQPPLPPLHDPFDADRQAPLIGAELPLCPRVAAPSASAAAAARWASPASTGLTGGEAEDAGFGGGGGVGGEGGGVEPFAWYSPPQPLHDNVVSPIPPLPLSQSPQHLMYMPPLSPGLRSALAMTAAAPAAFRLPSHVPIFEGGEEELMNLFDDDGDD